MNKIKKPTVSIGIPAYNEQVNIVPLLKRLLNQKQIGYKLKEIIVFSDGSSDNTFEYARSVKSPMIKVFKNDKRIGQQRCQNEMIDMFKGNVLVLIEADTLPYNRKTIYELIKPFINKPDKKLAMVVGNPVYLPPRNFFEHVLCHSAQLKKKIFADWKDGKNVYVSSGYSMKALSRSFAKKIYWPKNAPEDSYLYFRLKQLKLNLLKQDNAKVLVRNVDNPEDRNLQSKKFLSGRKALLKFFDRNTVKEEYKIPVNLLIKHLIINSIKQPFWTFACLFEIILNRLLTINFGKFSTFHKTYNSSKFLLFAKNLDN